MLILFGGSGVVPEILPFYKAVDDANAGLYMMFRISRATL